MRITKGQRIFAVFNYIFLTLLALSCILPILHLLAVSLSSKVASDNNMVGLIPVGFNTDSYKYLIQGNTFFRSFGVSVYRAVLGTAINILLIVLLAYPLSKNKEEFTGRPVYIGLLLFVMIFSAGMVPYYLFINDLNLFDTIWALVIPGSLSAFNLILMMNYFKTLPSALYEAAYIDGADHMTTLIKIVLPLSLPALASISLFVIMGHWNDYFSGMIYIRNPDLKPLQTYLRSVIIVEPSASDAASVESLEQNLTPDATNGAKIFLGLLPIMTLYPFLQKYFAKGIVRGSVKE